MIVLILLFDRMSLAAERAREEAPLKTTLDVTAQIKLGGKTPALAACLGKKKLIGLTCHLWMGHFLLLLPPSGGINLV